MKKKLILLFILLSVSSITVYALSNNFNIDISKLSLSENSKKKDVLDSFKKDYNLSYSISSEDDVKVEQFKNLAKKTTYLLLGDFNNKNESSEDFYKRKQEWRKLRYNPEIPKDENNIIGLDVNSQEYADDVISGMATAQIFSQANEAGLIYGSYGDIRVTFYDNLVICSVVLTNAKVKNQDPNDPMKYTYDDTNFTFYYYYKELKGEWKLYYLYGEDTKEVSNYINEVDESKSMSVAPSYQSELSKIYSFEKLEQMSQDELDNIYNSNIDKIVYLNGYYNNMVVSSANGFFINNNLVVTTWEFLEKALVNAQYITAGNNDSSYEIEGIVTANPSADIAVLKIKNVNKEPVRLGDSKTANKEDPAIILSSKLGVGSTVQTGIVISNSDYIQTSIPLSTNDGGSPLFNQSGEVIGINTTKSTNASISISVNSDSLKEIQDKFNNMSLDSIETISFEDLKEKYYYVQYDDEKITNSIPEKKWNEYSKIGNIKETINLEIVKASYKDGIVSLRYKNNMSKFIPNLQIASAFAEQLKKDGYELVMKNDSKMIYKNNNYQVIIMDEFDYLIVVMVKL